MSLSRRLDALELDELQRWAATVGREKGLTGRKVLHEMARYLADPTTYPGMMAFEAQLTDAERQELVGIKAHWRRLLRMGRR